MSSYLFDGSDELARGETRNEGLLGDRLFIDGLGEVFSFVR